MKLVLLFTVLVFTSCSNKVAKSNPKDATCQCNEFKAQGQVAYKSFTFCGETPTIEEYSYKVGPWKYWNSKGKLIAEGDYILKTRLVEGEGGCTYEIIQGKIDKSKWQFWSSTGFPIDVSPLTIKTYETCDVRLISTNTIE